MRGAAAGARARIAGAALLLGGLCVIGLVIAWRTSAPPPPGAQVPGLVKAVVFLIGLAGLGMVWLGAARLFRRDRRRTG